MAEALKLKDLRRLRARGGISRAEYEVVCNMMGRGLEADVTEAEISFRNGGEGPVATVTRGSATAIIYPANCCGDEERYFNGLVAAKYDVEGYVPQTR